jgi:hypothetical protein
VLYSDAPETLGLSPQTLEVNALVSLAAVLLPRAELEGGALRAVLEAARADVLDMVRLFAIRTGIEIY